MKNTLIGLDLGTTVHKGILVDEQLKIITMADPAAAFCDVQGISVSTQGICFVPVDRSLYPARNTSIWLDVRASDQLRSDQRLPP